jgi:membrane fusion protein (multidrug efflux system)
MGVALASAWMTWGTNARIPLYTVSESARLEVAEAPHPVDADRAGRVGSVRLTVGSAVQTGDSLVELDARDLQLEEAEMQARRAALGAVIEALIGELSAERSGRAGDEQAAQASLAEARSHIDEAEAPARSTRQEAEWLEHLRKEGLVNELDAQRSRAEADRRLAAAEAARLSVDRLAGEHRTRAGEREVRLRRIEGEIVRLRGEAATVVARLARLAHAIDERHIRAPVAGVLAEAADLRPGSVVSAGQRIATIVPAGSFTLVAQFLPGESFGRVRAGQPARVRWEGFPATQFGTTAATVSVVSSELREGRLRVLLSVRPNAMSAVPLGHGMPARVEVVTEYVTPVSWLLGAAGRLVARPVSAASSGDRLGGSR